MRIALRYGQSVPHTMLATANDDTTMITNISAITLRPTLLRRHDPRVDTAYNTTNANAPNAVATTAALAHGDDDTA